MTPCSRGLVRLLLVVASALPAMLVGCDRLDMYDEPRVDPLEASRFYKDGMSARPQVEGTIARGDLREDEALYTGRLNGTLVPQIPPQALQQIYDHRAAFDPKMTKTPNPTELRTVVLERGRDRFDIYCSACHGKLGDGDGMIVRRGMRRPPSFQIDRLREAPAGHFYDVVTVGFGAMPSYATRIEPTDRWAIIAYLRALQLSGDAKLDDVPAEQRAALENPAAATPVKEGGHE